MVQKIMIELKVQSSAAPALDVLRAQKMRKKRNSPSNQAMGSGMVVREENGGNSRCQVEV